jgi:hypothetical protein
MLDITLIMDADSIGFTDSHRPYYLSQLDRVASCREAINEARARIQAEDMFPINPNRADGIS